MTQKDLAKAIGVDETTISEIEYGRIKLATERLKAICRALGYKKVPQHFIAALELEPQWSLEELSDLVKKPL